MASVFSLNYRIVLLAVNLLPILLALGFWQLHRATEKEAIQHTYLSRQQQAPVPFTTLNSRGDLAYLPVDLQGQYDSEKMFLLDNRVHQGQVGYDVLSPFELDTGDWVIVNRGWIAAPARRTELPTIPAVSKTPVSLRAEVYVPPGEGFQLSSLESNESAWPKIVTVFDATFLSEQLQRKLFPYQLRLSSGQPGALITDWPPINVSPAKHRAYAVQWFAMAIGLVGWLIIATWRKQTKPANL